MSHTILYTSDTHGNPLQLEHLLQHARAIKADTLIVAGEIAPKWPQDMQEYLSEQQEFVRNALPSFARRCKNTLPKMRLFIGLGNDDAAVLLPILEQYEQEGFFKLLNKRHALTPQHDIVGYGYVPITPFGIKDWEKYDLSQPKPEQAQAYEHLKRTNYCLQGIKSSRLGWHEFSFTPHLEQRDSIQKDLEKEIYTKNAKTTLYVFHAPPYNTVLDMLHSREHVGSLAVRAFIENHQPFATLHGHIHETVDVSGAYRASFIPGFTVSMSAGNHNEGGLVAALVFDVDKPEKAQRILLPKLGIFSFLKRKKS